MLHNRLLKFDGLDRLGRAEEDWIAAGLSEDDRRIDASNAAFAFRMQSGGTQTPEVDWHPAHDQLRETLITHYKHAWCRREVLWRVSAARSRGLHATRFQEHDNARDPNEDLFEEEGFDDDELDDDELDDGELDEEED